jgi:hydroxyacylglutathione hydrolase
LNARTAIAVDSIQDDALSNTSYLVEMGEGIGVVVDPPRDVDPHLELATARGIEIVATLETHVHADYVSGSRELALRAGSEVIASREAHLHHADRQVRDGDQLRWGSRTLRVMATPGHTPDHVAFVLLEDDRPVAVFTGGSLILGGAARTDLFGPEHTEALARAQYRSLQLLATLPDETAVLPTHGAGSFCLAAAVRTTDPTIGTERRSNPLLQIDDEDEFVRQLLAGFGSFPTYYEHLPELNRRGPRLVNELPEPEPMGPERVMDLMRTGAWLVDARPIHDWALGHPGGAVSIELRPAFASWLGWVVPFEAPVVLLVDDDRRSEALRLARMIGYDKIVGWVDGGISAWKAAGLPMRHVDEVDPLGAQQRVDSGAVLLDVRQGSELERGRIATAHHLELGDIVAGRMPDAHEVVTFCGHGERSATAASLLERHGIEAVNLVGGIAAWEAEGLPVDR